MARQPGLDISTGKAARASTPSVDPPAGHVRLCLACGHHYPLQHHACPRCASHAGDVVEAPKPKPRRRTTKK